MNLDVWLKSLALPRAAYRDERIPKKLLLEQGLPTRADRTAVQQGIAELRWHCAIQPAVCGVPAYSDSVCAYEEIHVLLLRLQTAAPSGRLVELLHRAMPYPLLVFVEQNSQYALSLANKRWARNDSSAWVLDGTVLTVALPENELTAAFRSSLGLQAQRRTQMQELYQSWWNCLECLDQAEFTVGYTLARSPAEQLERRACVARLRTLRTEIATLRQTARKQNQLRDRATTHLRIEQLQQEFTHLNAKTAPCCQGAESSAWLRPERERLDHALLHKDKLLLNQKEAL